jgi:hypothetical protein
MTNNNSYPPDILERLEFIQPKHSGPKINDIPNDTVPLELAHVKYDAKCEDCDTHLCEIRVVHSKKLVTPYVHWSKQCQVCKFYQCADTGKYILNNVELRHQHLLKAGKSLPGCGRGRKSANPLSPAATKGRPPGSANKKGKLPKKLTKLQQQFLDTRNAGSWSGNKPKLEDLDK